MADIYEYSGFYYLLLKEASDTFKELVWCSVNYDLNNLLLVQDYAALTPNLKWTYVKKVSNKEYQSALAFLQKHFESSNETYVRCLKN